VIRGRGETGEKNLGLQFDDLIWILVTGRIEEEVERGKRKFPNLDAMRL
jgi:hypothetical protein